MNLRGIAFERQKPIPIEYKGVRLDCGYRADLVVERKVLVEIKALDALTAINEAQLLTYLRLGHWHVGLILNFNVQFLKQGSRRRVLDLPEEIVL